MKTGQIMCQIALNISQYYITFRAMRHSVKM
ncbi:MAG: hypothetical protein K0R57_3871 [Paenibacillaceae bacterium]|jgi:hypothetical protein|nr:hypothetical protein [Paenibacillaceae bacterium]